MNFIQSCPFGRGAVVAAIAIAGTLLTSCADAGPGGPRPDQSAPDAVRPLTTAATVAGVAHENFSAVADLPVAALQVSPERQALLANALAVRQSSCMAAYGVRFAGETVSASAAADPMQRRYGVADLPTARTLGYHLPGKDAGRTAAATVAVPAAARALLDGAARSAAGGVAVPAGGCTGAARRALADTAPTAADVQRTGRALGVISRIDATSFEQTRNSPALAPTMRAWSRCMSGHGYRFATPFAALQSVDLRTAAPGAAEIRLATADAACKQTVGLVRTWAGLEAPLQRRAIAAAATELAPYRTALQTRLTAAARTLGLAEVPR